jgi:hypothetical protein
LLPAALILYLSLPALSAARAVGKAQVKQPRSLRESPLTVPLPQRFELEQNSPNPFKFSTAIGYTVRIGEQPVKVTIEILDSSGKCVRTLVDDVHNPGQYSFCWRGTDDEGKPLESGTYFCRLRADDREATRQVVIAE